MRENINDLLAFAAVATDQSFTRAAARLGTSQSSLSRTIRKLEERLGVRLLTRTTRSVSPTEAGGRLLQKIGPRLDEIEAELEALGALRDKPAGNVRINCSEYAAESVVWPKLAKVLPAYPDIKVEIFIQHSFADIAAERFDAGVRLGESLEKDMIAVRIAPDDRLIAVGSPSYFERHAPPETPRGPDSALLHQPSSGDARRSLCMGVREGRRITEREGRRAGYVQHHQADGGRGAGRLRNRLRPRVRPPCPPGQRRSGPSPRRLVPAVLRLPPLLSQPPPTVVGVRGRHDCTAASGVSARAFAWHIRLNRALVDALGQLFGAFDPLRVAVGQIS